MWYFELVTQSTEEKDKWARLKRIERSHDLYYIRTIGDGDCLGNPTGKKYVDSLGEVCSICGFEVTE